MKRWRFAFTARWARYLGLAVVFAIACGCLSWWQLSRREEKVTEMHRVEQNYEAAPVPLDSLLPTPGSFDEDDEWRPVEVTGVYEEQLLVRGRPFGGRVGFEVLAPLRLADGSVFVIDRGWLPPGSEAGYPDEVPDPPRGEVTVIARLKPGEPSLPGGTTDRGVLASIRLGEVARLLQAPVYEEAYGLLASEDPAAAEMPEAAPKPRPDEGPHLSYAFQWVIFAIIGFVGLGWAIRQEYRYRNAEDPAEMERAAKRERRRAAKRTDADVEDELIDSAR